jgi:hypothetical protein
MRLLLDGALAGPRGLVEPGTEVLRMPSLSPRVVARRAEEWCISTIYRLSLALYRKALKWRLARSSWEPVEPGTLTSYRIR